MLNIKPIISSLLDTDAYKLHMQQAIYHAYKEVTVVAKFHCRSNNFLGKYFDCVPRHLNLMSRLFLTLNEYNYLKSLTSFKEDYLDWLKKFRFNPDNIDIEINKNNQLSLKIKGLWCEVTLWEVPLLALISEIFYKDNFPFVTIKDAIIQLRKIIKQFYEDAKIHNIDLSKFKLVDFGTRRRFSRSVQYAIIKELKTNFPFFLGTSNYNIARKLNIQPIGTQSHEWFQAHQQISVNIVDSQKIALEKWLNEYPNDSGIALTDCINMNVFLNDFGINFVDKYKGLRHDSGDPLEWGEKAINHYRKFGIDPMTKTLVFSDSLDLQKSLLIYKHFYKRINLIFCIGTRLTCNIPDINPLNIVLKLVKCNGKPVAKLSDSYGKTFCDDYNFVSFLKKKFNI